MLSIDSLNSGELQPNSARQGKPPAVIKNSAETSLRNSRYLICSAEPIAVKNSTEICIVLLYNCAHFKGDFPMISSDAEGVPQSPQMQFSLCGNRPGICYSAERSLRKMTTAGRYCHHPGKRASSWWLRHGVNRRFLKLVAPGRV